MLALNFHSFNYHREPQERGPDIFKLYQEASTLQIGEPPREIELVCPKGSNVILVKQIVLRTYELDSFGDITGWVYVNRAPCKGTDGKYYHFHLTIFND